MSTMETDQVRLREWNAALRSMAAVLAAIVFVAWS